MFIQNVWKAIKAPVCYASLAILAGIGLGIVTLTFISLQENIFFGFKNRPYDSLELGPGKIAFFVRGIEKPVFFSLNEGIYEIKVDTTITARTLSVHDLWWFSGNSVKKIEIIVDNQEEKRLLDYLIEYFRRFRPEPPVSGLKLCHFLVYQDLRYFPLSLHGV